MPAGPRALRVIDSHTGGEPTRVVVSGGPDLPRLPLAEQREILRREHDWLRSAVVNEPRGSEVLVGALLCGPLDPGAAAGVVFFNNVGYLGMCGHGTIGLVVTLAHLGWVGPGRHAIETPVGSIRFKIARRGGETLNASPEFEDCARAAAERGLPVKQVLALAAQAYWHSRRD